MFGSNGRGEIARRDGLKRLARVGFRVPLAVLAAVLLVPSHAIAGSFTTISLASKAPNGTAADGMSSHPVMSGDGSVVFFQTQASNLGAAVQDIVAREVASGHTTVLSVGIGGADANGASGSASASSDGRYVAFTSVASNLVAGDNNNAHDVFVCDRITGSVTAVSVTASGTVADGDSHSPAISADGRYVAFVSSANDLSAGDTNGHDDVFVRDLVGRTTVLVSRSRLGGTGNGGSSTPAIDADGSRVAFSSMASDVVAGDTNGQSDIFVANRDGSAMVRVSVTSSGTQPALGSFSPSIDRDGRRVAFESLSADLVTGDTNGTRDVFVRDLTAGTIVRASTTAAGVQGNGESRDAHICADGTAVAFVSMSTNLVGGDANGAADVFVSHLSTRFVSRMSNTRTGSAGNGASSGPAYCGTGGALAFYSSASDIGVGDTNGVPDVFVARFGTRVYQRVAGRDRYTTAVEASKLGFPSGAPAVVIATGSNWPDALGGSALAGVAGAPLLLTPTGGLTPTVRSEIKRLKARKAYILGGTASVSSAVETEVRSLVGGSVVRLGGSDRYAAATAIGREVVRLQGKSFSGSVIVATGGNYPDALAGSPVAAAARRPIVLVNPATGSYALPTGTRRVVILGGPASVSATVESKLRSRLGSGAVRRLGGTDRYDAAAGIAQWAVDDVGLSWHGVSLATGEKFPDALSGGVMAARRGSVIMLTRGTVLSARPAGKLGANSSVIGQVHIVGGPASVSDSVYRSIRKTLGD